MHNVGDEKKVREVNSERTYKISKNIQNTSGKTYNLQTLAL